MKNDIMAVENELRDLADWAHNNISSKTNESWERLSKKLVCLADMLRASYGRHSHDADQARMNSI